MTFWQENKENIYIKLYDDLASDLKTGDELAFIKKIFSKNQKLIEFGCGTGRTMIPLLKYGYNISGLDYSKGMLKSLLSKCRKLNLKPQIFKKDLTKFTLKNKFDGGILSQRTLNFITTGKDQKKALLNIAKTLKPGATLIINLIPGRPDDFAKKQLKLKKTGSFTNTETGNIVGFWENWIPDPINQIWDLSNKFSEKGKSITTKMKMRVIFKTEMEYLLELCGFRVLGTYGSWRGIAYDEKSKDLIFVVKKI